MVQATKNTVADYAQQVLEQVRKVIVGKDQTLMWVMAVILAKGHILLEDIPGVGKTTMAVAFSKVLDLTYSRVQFTPDVLPSDVTGYSIPDQATGQMIYKPGAVICNLFLADELNRATSRTQSALLEAMEEGQVTVDGVVHKLQQPFVVIATQNPTGAAGTQMLPDSQMDRFAIRLSLGYPDMHDECDMVLQRQGKDPMAQLQPLLTQQTLTAMQEEVSKTYIGEAVVKYAVSLVAATRNWEGILRGASPRATLCVISVAKALAQLQGRDYVLPKDIRESFVHTVKHRILLTNQAENSGKQVESILQGILQQVAAPALR